MKIKAQFPVTKEQAETIQRLIRIARPMREFLAAAEQAKLDELEKVTTAVLAGWPTEELVKKQAEEQQVRDA